jgi:lysophospholipase L1-like esterase
VIDRLEGIINLQPKKIFITIGVNDLQRQYPKETVINNIKKTANILLAGDKKQNIPSVNFTCDRKKTSNRN